MTNTITESSTHVTPASTAPTSLFDGRAVVVRGTLRWVVLLLVALGIAQSLALVVLCGYGFTLYRKLAEKRMVVVRVGDLKTEMLDAEALHSGPYDVEVLRTAWDVVRFTRGADSTSVQHNFEEAKRLMTAEMAQTFSAEVEPRKKDIIALQFYSLVEAKPEDVRFMTPQDLPPNADPESIGRFDVIISGLINTYRLGTQEPLSTDRFNYHVTLVPTERTVEHPHGLMVRSMLPYTPPNNPARKEMNYESAQ